MQRTTIAKPEHGSIEWLKLRHRDETGWPVVSASDAAAVHGEHRFKTKYALAAEKLLPEPPVTEQNRAMERGTRLEPVILEWVADELGEQIATPELMYTMSSNGAVMVATLDGVIGDETSPDKVVEIKTYGKHFDADADLEGYGPLPAYWYWQGVHQATCADVEEVVWGVFDASLDLHIYVQHVSSDEKGKHVERVADFCRHLAVGLILPEWEHTYEDLSRNARVNDKAVNLDQHQQLLVQLMSVQAEKKGLTEREDELKAELATLLDGATTGTVGGATAVTWKQQSRSGFDQKRFASEHPELYDEYKTSSTFRVLRFVKGNQ